MSEPEKAAASETTPNAKSELPHVESPSISPAGDAPADAEKPEPEIHALTVFKPRAEEKTDGGIYINVPNFTITRRMKRRLATAATIGLAAAFGAIFGALAGHQWTPPEQPKVDTAAVEETDAMRKSIAHLSKELAALKAGVDSTARSAAAQIGKVSDKLADRIDRLERSDVTASITKTALTTPAPVAVETPLPQARPALPPQIVQGWTARAARNGAILVEGRGEVYEVKPGVPLPGLGTVESVKRDGERWVVSTPKGIIVSSNIEPPPQRRRGYYPPYYFRPF